MSVPLKRHLISYQTRVRYYSGLYSSASSKE